MTGHCRVSVWRFMMGPLEFVRRKSKTFYKVPPVLCLVSGQKKWPSGHFTIAVAQNIETFFFFSLNAASYTRVCLSVWTRSRTGLHLVQLPASSSQSLCFTLTPCEHERTSIRAALHKALKVRGANALHCWTWPTLQMFQAGWVKTVNHTVCDTRKKKPSHISDSCVSHELVQFYCVHC